MTSRCGVCALPRDLLDQVHGQAQRGVPLRTMAAALDLVGHADILKDQLHRHLQAHVVEGEPILVCDRSTNWMAATVAAALVGFPSVLAKLASELASEGMEAEATILSSGLSVDKQDAIRAARGSDAETLLTMRAVGLALQQVLKHGHADTSRAIAAALRSARLPDVAEVFDEYAVAAETGIQTTLDQPKLTDEGDPA